MIRYKKRRRYKYTLYEDYRQSTRLRPAEPVLTRFIELAADGTLTVKASYAWDGPSGPTIDTKDFMRGSLVHDALYQLLRERRLPREERRYADVLLRDICLEDGMSRLYAWIVYWSVRLFAASSAKPDLLEAP